VINAATQLALREWRAHMLSPLTATALVSVTAILALVGPYGTILSLSLPERAAYWGLLVVLGYAVGFFASVAFLRTPAHGAARLGCVALAGVLTGAVVSLIVMGLNLVVFGFTPDLPELPGFVATIMVISIIVMAVLDLFSRHFASAAQPVSKAGGAPTILSRLPLDKRGPLVALSVEDHYVRIRTTKGEDIQLMRLADAMREVGETPGAQVHRSHWVAFEHVTKVTRQGDRATLYMAHGGDIPVSRANIPRLKEAGLLP
jgi:DNA-binding LytR/AlgR family response regulator